MHVIFGEAFSPATRRYDGVPEFRIAEVRDLVPAHRTLGPRLEARHVVDKARRSLARPR